MLPVRLVVIHDCNNSSSTPKKNGIRAIIIRRYQVSILFLFSYRRTPVKKAYIIK